MNLKKGGFAAGCLGGGAALVVFWFLITIGSGRNVAPRVFQTNPFKSSTAPVVVAPQRAGAVLDLSALLDKPRADVQKAFRVQPNPTSDDSEVASVEGLGDVTLIYRAGRLQQFFVAFKPTRASIGDALRTVGFDTPSVAPFRYSADGVFWWNQDAQGKAFKRLGGFKSNGGTDLDTGFNFVAAELP